MKKLMRLTLAAVVVLILIFLLRVPLLRCVGNYLIYEEPHENVEAIFVLSGDPWDRGNEAARLFHEGFSDHIVCTGLSVPRLFLITKINYLESELTKMHLVSLDVPEKKIGLIKEGTSTNEESVLILDYCKKNKLKKVAVLSTKFHTRRIKYSFQNIFKDSGVELKIWGAPSSNFDEQFWWKGEAGAIFVNNEYIKILYYLVKH